MQHPLLIWSIACSFLGIDNFYIYLHVPFIERRSPFILRALESMVQISILIDKNKETERKRLRNAFKYTNLKEELCMVLRKRPRHWI